jgi:hypothetical protein
MWSSEGKEKGPRCQVSAFQLCRAGNEETERLVLLGSTCGTVTGMYIETSITTACCRRLFPEAVYTLDTSASKGPG